MAAKKKKNTKKKASKKGAARKRSSTNPLALKLTVHPEMKVERGHVYLVKAHGAGKSAIDLGHVTATSETQAKSHAKNFARRLL